MQLTKKTKTLSRFSLIMISIIAVDSIRTLPISAEYGSKLISVYVLAGLLFLLPIALIAAELASGWPQTGGIYVWVKQAFGKRWGFMVAWLQWLYNIIWFPTILAMLTVTGLTVIAPQSINNKPLICACLLISFWLVTLLNCFGIRVSSLISTIGAIVGTLLPITLIVALGAIWMSHAQPIQVNFSAASMAPTLSLNDLSMLSAVVFGLIGIEVCAAFAGDAKNPQRDYPRAMFISAAIIITSLILGSLAIAIIIPQKQIQLASGIMDSFKILLNYVKMSRFEPLIALFIIIGGIGGISTWITAPTRCLMVAAEDGIGPKWLAKQNRYGAAYRLLITQGLIFTPLALVFLLFPKFNSSYWFLSNLTSEISILIYIVMFAAFIKLRQSQPNVKRAYRIPGGIKTAFCVGGIPLVTAAAIFLLGLLPPEQLSIQPVSWYETLLIGGIALTCFSGWLIAKQSQN